MLSNPLVLYAMFLISLFLGFSNPYWYFNRFFREHLVVHTSLDLVFTFFEIAVSYYYLNLGSIGFVILSYVMLLFSLAKVLYVVGRLITPKKPTAIDAPSSNTMRSNLRNVSNLQAFIAFVPKVPVCIFAYMAMFYT